MRSLVCTTPGNFEYYSHEVPPLRKGYSLLRIKQVGICGTDLHAFEGTQPYFEYPRILGHELAGEYVDGDAQGFSKDEPVTIIPYLHCGECIACRNNKSNCCVKMRVCGVHIDGGMAEYFAVPSSALVHGEGLGLDELAMIENLSIAAHGLGRADVKPGEKVLIMGAGPIGVGIIQMVTIAGGIPIVLEANENRIEFAREQSGVALTINARNENVPEKLKEFTNGEMPTVVFDATGSGNAINAGFLYPSHGGRYILVGLQKEQLGFSHPEFHKRELTLMSSRNATRDDFTRVIQLIKNGLLDPVSNISIRQSERYISRLSQSGK
jgi:2-desacetyl-2-hydroxyethyl bacteriochlorophyllide A dehydrogenase